MEFASRLCPRILTSGAAARVSQCQGPLGNSTGQEAASSRAATPMDKMKLTPIYRWILILLLAAVALIAINVGGSYATKSESQAQPTAKVTPNVTAEPEAK